MYLIKTPGFVQSLFPNFIWKGPSQHNNIYLTFDDGPVPEVTPWVLDLLAQFDAKATFFCVGENAQRYPELIERIRKEGHSLGNHTHNHLSGWNSENMDYFHNIRKCAQLVQSDLFRPPYGKMKPKQAQFLQRHYRIVMWDVLSGDFDEDMSGTQVADNVIRNAKEGSIVVFHDSIKSMKTLKEALPMVLQHFHEAGYEFKAIGDQLAWDGRPAVLAHA